MSSQAVISEITSDQFKQSVLRKCRESAEMKAKFFEANAGMLRKKFAASWRKVIDYSSWKRRQLL